MVSSEISIPVPWGIIAGKTWGKPHDPPILLVHGIIDNAGSFDRLVPLLPKNYFYVCIDLPGHGRSTHFQKGVLGNFLMYVIAVRYVIDHFKWVKLYYIGHSFGGQIGLYVTSVFADFISKFVIIDSLPPQFIQIPKTLKSLRELFEKHLEFTDKLQKSKPPQYSYEEALDRMITYRRTNMSPTLVKFLAERTLVKTEEGGYRFTSDPQLRMLPYPLFSVEQVQNIVSGIVCPTLIIFATDSVYSTNLHKNERVTNVYFNMANLRYYSVKGNHDVHIISPERIAPVISDFLNEQQCHL